ncbi:PAQR family membrane homeostasis protein TrhA [Parvularcula sp. LCG005]|uniref:PAQR family membrane homeostasis protein TrhA n=1 Tax=Parvularcula sp. LCG005 TaxID=3078805 RepID=UPI002941E9E8|nr:hemolysin III family protein [Parvularcula sp. LCG005]WOI53530.1 hemolysin III family protein [Parvularcula sp. LCG005]
MLRTMILPRAYHDGRQVHTALEEILHAVTHGIGIALAIAALVFLILKAVAWGTALEVTAVSIYGGCAIFLYLASTIYHAAFKLSVQPFLEVVDHAAIYLKIAGSYTPFALITLPELSGKVIMAVVWTIAGLGVAYKFIAHYVDRLRGKHDWISLAGYVGMGWIAIFVVHQLFRELPVAGFIWLVAGGLCFTVGAFFYAWRSRRYTHTIFHVFVLAGSICHFVSIYGFVLPGRDT